VTIFTDIDIEFYVTFAAE